MSCAERLRRPSTVALPRQTRERVVATLALLGTFFMASVSKADDVTSRRERERADGVRAADAAAEADGVRSDAAPLDAAPVDAAPLDAVPLDAVPVDAVQLDHRHSEVHLVYRPAGCVLGASSTMNGIIPVLDEIRNVGKIKTTFGMVARASGDRVMWNASRIIDVGPIDAIADEEGVSAVSVRNAQRAAERAPAKTGEERVVEQHIPYLESAEEIVVQVPFDGQRDWLRVIEEGAPGSPWLGRMARRQGRLVERKTENATVLMLIPDEPFADFTVTTRTDDVVHAIDLRTFAGENRLSVGGDEVSIVSIGKRYGMAERTVEEIAGLLHDVPRERAFLVHAGGLLDELARDISRDGCTAVLARSRPDVYVPSSGDLLLGPDALVDGARAHALPLVMTNLEPLGVSADDVRALAPRSRLFTLDDHRRMLVLGVVGESVLSRLPADVRARYRYQNPNEAVTIRIEEERARLGVKPDLVVVVTSGNASEAALLSTNTHVDIVIGDASRYDLVRRHEVVYIDEHAGGREGLGRMAPAFVTRPSRIAVGRVTAHFEDDVLTRLEHVSRPVTNNGPVDAHIAYFKELILRGHSDAVVLLPDAEDLVTGKAELERFIYGERTLISGGIRQYTRALPPRYTDPLWMRIVTNLVRERLDVDACILRNLPRGSNVTGPIVKGIVEDWLLDVETVEIVTLDGASLVAILERVKAQEDDLALSGTDYVFVAGADPNSLVIGGRPIGRELRYRVAITDSLRALPEVARVLSKATRVERRFVQEGGRATPSSSGGPLRLRGLVIAALEEQADRSAEDASPAQRARIESWLEDKSSKLASEWQIRVDELAATGSIYRNSPNIQDFQASRETRTTTPDLYNFGLRLRSSVVFDGPNLAWDTGARALYNAIIVDLGDGSFPRNEPLDDIVLYSELRLNRARLAFDDGAYAILPFARFAVDSEFTATTNPTDPTSSFPHQALVQQSVGLVAYLGTMVQELRLGLLVQEDFSEALVPGGQTLSGIHLDAGIVFGLRLRVPFWIFRFESETDGRYLAPDPDDRIADLALRVQSVNKIVVPLGNAFSVFAFGDVFLVSGKLDANRTPGASAIFGAGVEFRDVWRF
jgi:hypothetical protein